MSAVQWLDDNLTDDEFKQRCQELAWAARERAVWAKSEEKREQARQAIRDIARMASGLWRLRRKDRYRA